MVQGQSFVLRYPTYFVDKLVFKPEITVGILFLVISVSSRKLCITCAVQQAQFSLNEHFKILNTFWVLSSNLFEKMAMCN